MIRADLRAPPTMVTGNSPTRLQIVMLRKRHTCSQGLSAESIANPTMEKGLCSRQPFVFDVLPGNQKPVDPSSKCSEQPYVALSEH